ncbi:MAG: hypothetical protein CMJ19_08730 [Phycisphaeraceae bacterium]|nr:hypothetical protein [Phycisphaeraceae bacterium]
MFTNPFFLIRQIRSTISSGGSCLATLIHNRHPSVACPYSLLPTPYSLLPTPYSLVPTPWSQAKRARSSYTNTMHMITIILAMGLLLHDAFVGMDMGPVGNNAAYALAVMILPKAILVLLYHRLCQQALRRPTKRKLKRLDRVGAALRLMLLACYGFDLAAGCLTWLRVTVGDWILLDEALLLMPTIVTQLLFWRVYYPVDRKVREAMAFNAIDNGEPVAPIWTRRQYLLAQIRHSLLIPGVPLLILLAWTETLNMMPEEYLTLPNGYDLQTPLSLFGTAIVFLLTPVMIRKLWDTQALPASPMRSRLLQLCKQYRVGVREILHWKTFGGMANGAVIGFIGPLRYILLTDVLLARMTGGCVEAVMAHEIAHVKKKHMFWMIAGAGAMLVIYELLFGVMIWYAGSKLVDWVDGSEDLQSTIDNASLIISLLLAVIAWLVSFGWLSRRMERQADSFAVAHMAKTHGHERIEPEDAYAMIQALEEVAVLNHVRPEKKSWRHGSIRWRQDYLKTLVTRCPNQLPIDRLMRWLCVLIFLAVLLSSWLLMGGIDKIENYLTPTTPAKVYII